MITAEDLRRKMPTVEQYLAWFADHIIPLAEQGYGAFFYEAPADDDETVEGFIFNTVAAFNSEGVCGEVAVRLEELGYQVETDEYSITITWGHEE